MDETLDWMDEFDDSVFTDIIELTDSIEANDSSALTGFDNTETSAETTNPLEANETVNETEADNNISDDFFTNFTPTINFSMTGPSSMNNDASSKGDKPSGGTKDDDGGPDIDIDDYYGGGKTDGDDPDDQGGYGNNWDNDDGGPDIDLDDYYGGDKTDGDDDDDDDYGSWTDKDRLEAAKEAAEAAGNESAAASAEAELAYKEYNDLYSHIYDEKAKLDAAKEVFDEALNNYEKSVKDCEDIYDDELKKVKTVTFINGAELAYYEYTGTNTDKKAAIDALNKAVDRLAKADADYKNVDKSWNDYVNSLKDAELKTVDANKKDQEMFEKAQAAEEYAGTLAGEAKEAFDRAKKKQEEWEQKQKEIEAAEAAKAAEAAEAAKAAEIDGKSDSDNNTSTDTNSAINNTTTFNLAESLAKTGVKMTEKEYGQVADFVAKYPGLASFIDGGLTNVEKSAIGNVIAGIQAINAGNYLTAVKEFAQAFGMTLVSTFQLLATKAYGLGPRILGIIKSFMENENINYYNHNKDFETFKKMRDEYGDSSELQALYDTAKGTTDQKQTFDYMKDNAATNVGEYNEGLVEDVNKVVSDASRKIIHYSPYVLEAVKKWR